jgi:general secretion pathway protein G
MRTQNASPRHPRQGGFTLVEIMVVVVIIGLLATLVVPAVMGRKADADINKAQADLATIHNAANLFMLKSGKAPEMDDLLSLDSNGHPWIEGGKVPQDPWGRDYTIRQLEGRLRIEVVSSGPDGIEDTEDDLVYPQRKQ